VETIHVLCCASPALLVFSIWLRPDVQYDVQNIVQNEVQYGPKNELDPHLPLPRTATSGSYAHGSQSKYRAFMLGGDTVKTIVRSSPSHSDTIGVKVIVPACPNRKQEAKSTHNQSLYHPLRQQAVDVQFAGGRNVYLPVGHGWGSEFDSRPRGISGSRLRAVVQFRCRRGI
jgi:hypothetical protein